MSMHGSKRDSLLEIYQAALHAVNGRVAVAERLTRTPLEGAVRMVAVGKAAQSMAEGAWDRLNRQITQGLIISKPGHLDLSRCGERGWEAIEGGHPLPDSGSLSAGNRLLEFLSDDDPTPLLFLISGGASSLVECPVDGVDEGLLVRANAWLLSSGLAISQMNLVRKGLSRIKGGGLLQWVAGRQIRALAISDVAGDDPATIGSGLLVPAPGLQAGLQQLSLPEWLEGPLQRGLDQRADMPQQGPEIELVANLGLAKLAAAERASAIGIPVRVIPDFIAGDAAEEGWRLAAELLRGGPGVTIWGGETTVRLPETPGRGGRNQHLALAAAQGLAGSEGVWLLAAGTDGTDGPTEDAGALVDGATIHRAETEGMDVAQNLRRADAGSLLEATGDLITTGPTGTNVMDLMIGLKL
jgi:hydroxypyruvate reductase